MPKNQGLTDGEVLGQVRDLVRNGCLKWTLHSEERMAERGYDHEQVKECLLKGNFTERPVIPNRPGPIEYSFRMSAVVDGSSMHVGASLVPETRVVVITVMDSQHWS
jgi:hypothetical protein